MVILIIKLWLRLSLQRVVQRRVGGIVTVLAMQKVSCALTQWVRGWFGLYAKAELSQVAERLGRVGGEVQQDVPQTPSWALTSPVRCAWAARVGPCARNKLLMSYGRVCSNFFCLVMECAQLKCVRNWIGFQNIIVSSTRMWPQVSMDLCE